MKVSHTEPPQAKEILAQDMPNESLAVSRTGIYYVRSQYGDIFCLNDLLSWRKGATSGLTAHVRVLPPGTVVHLEIS